MSSSNIAPVAVVTTERRDTNGQFNHGLDRMCKLCGHTKGEHDAEKPFAQGDLESGFECVGFKAVRKA